MADRREQRGRPRRCHREGRPPNELRSVLASVPARPLWAVALLAATGDLATTVFGLQAGLSEQNPVVVQVLASHGVAGLVGLKLSTLGLAALVWTTVKRHYAVAAMIGVTVPQAVAVLLNVATIAVFLG